MTILRQQKQALVIPASSRKIKPFLLNLRKFSRIQTRAKTAGFSLSRCAAL